MKLPLNFLRCVCFSGKLIFFSAAALIVFLFVVVTRARRETEGEGKVICSASKSQQGGKEGEGRTDEGAKWEMEGGKKEKMNCSVRI